jgi:uncharacterized damage-inducible protein DinB
MGTIMSIADNFLAEFTSEAKTTRKFLQRLPEDKLAWQAHPKSMTAGQLALHMAASPGGIVQMATQDEFPFSQIRNDRTQPESLEQILSAFNESVATVTNVLPTITDEQMHQTWRLMDSGKELLAMPRTMVIRNILLNHIYHHRGQFGVYLRLVGAKVPSAYGPSGDELPEFLAAKQK